jgi:mono/diheme cytochrome c family protein
MKALLKVVGGLLAVLVVVIAGIALYIDRSGIPRYTPGKVQLKVDVTPDGVARGKRTLVMLCAGCHLDPATGALSGKHLADMPAQFGTVSSANITKDPQHGIGAWTDGEIAYLLRTGIAKNGRYTPPWMVKLPHMSDADLADLIAFLRSDDPLVRPVAKDTSVAQPSFLTKFLARVAFRPLPYPSGPVEAPPASDQVAFGRYLLQGRFSCFPCHSQDFAKVNELEPEKSAGYLGGGNRMPDLTGRSIATANLTPDPETGIGKWSEDDFRRALKVGIRPDRTPLVYPMLPYPELTDEEANAIFAYLKTVPPIKNAVPRPEPAVLAAGAPRGKVAYYQYACNTCHGDSGQGLYDLRPGVKKYTNDDELIAWIRHPEKLRPGVRMPTWDGVIAEDDYVPLAQYVRSLGGPAATP